MYKSIQINDFRLFKGKSIILGKYLTALSGRNSTGKSTILGMIANSGELKKKDGVTYSSRAFRAEFSELFKGSREYDQIGPNRFEITLCDESGNDVDYRSFRTAWQQTDKARKVRASKEAKDEPVDESASAEKSVAEVKRERFRIIPFKMENGKKTEAKFKCPVIYLGLSRLFPLGESGDDAIGMKPITFKSEEHKQWFLDNYKRILSLQVDVQNVATYNIGETDKKSGIGINTDHYDYLTNSSGQDNLGQILLALLSFRKLKEDRGDAWNGGVLLIDEIDSTLHPAAQSRLINLLIEEARVNRYQIVLTTHSLSLLRDICGKTAYNSHDNNVNNNVELYYLTTANRRLEIKRNISFTEIERDLTVTSIVQSNNKLKVYTEDDEARWFLRGLIPDYLPYLELLNTKIGCDELINIYNADMSYFGNTLIVFDGDVKDSQIAKIPGAIRQRLNNILTLPGSGSSPEKIIYNYLLSLQPDHDFWNPETSSLGLTWDYFHEHGPLSDDYSDEKERDKYKKWFINHRPFFDSTKILDFWLRDYASDVELFRIEFIKIYNHIAKRTAAAEVR